MLSMVESVDIFWHEGDDKALTSVNSDNVVLKDFFEIQGWQSVHEMSKCVATHKTFDESGRGFEFKIRENEAVVEVYTDSGYALLQESAFISLMLYLFELLIAGANDNHHTIRYEPWWQAFIEYMYQIQDQIH